MMDRVLAVLAIALALVVFAGLVINVPRPVYGAAVYSLAGVVMIILVRAYKRSLKR